MESDSRRDISCSVQISVKVNTVSVRLCLHTLATARVRLHQLFVIVSNVLKRIRCAVHLVFVKLLFCAVVLLVGLATHLTALSGTTQISRYQKGKPIWILLKQDTVSGSSIHWAICKSALHSRHITTPAPHHSVFYGPDALPATQPTVSKH